MATPENGGLAAQNQEFFDAHAISLYSQDWVKAGVQQVIRLVRENVDDLGIKKRAEGAPPVRLLDYACGFGAATQAFSPYIDEARGIDVSDTMVDGYNKRAKEAGYSNEQMHAVRANLLSSVAADTRPATKLGDFDIAVISLALHHVDDPARMVAKLVEKLQPGGVLAVIDLANQDTEGHGHGHGHGHHDHQHADLSTHPTAKTIHHEHKRFKQDFMAKIFEEAGCSASSFRYVEFGEPFLVPESVTKVEGGRKERIFLASAKKEELAGAS